MKFCIKDFFSKCDQIRRFLKKSLIENFICCAVICCKIFGIYFTILCSRRKILKVRLVIFSTLCMKGLIKTRSQILVTCGFADLVTFTEEILNGKLHFSCSVPRIKFLNLFKHRDNADKRKLEVRPDV